MRYALIAVLLIGTACSESRKDRVAEALATKGFSDVELSRKNSATYDFTAIREGVSCEGTATVKESERGYTAGEAVEVEWRCR